jgi:hypothetical protein
MNLLVKNILAKKMLLLEFYAKRAHLGIVSSSVPQDVEKLP